MTATYGEKVHNLAAMLAEREDPAVVTLTDDATRVRIAAATEIERQLRPGGALHDMRGWADKLFGTTLRLAGLLHVAHHPDDAWRLPIEGERMAEAVRLVAFFVAHYRAALHIISGDSATDLARQVLRVLIDKDMRTFTRRELHRRMHRQFPQAAQVAAVLDTLAQLGWVRATDGGYHLHPRAADYANPGDTVTNSPASDVSAAQDTSPAVTGPW